MSSFCNLCPRECSVERNVKKGFCSSTEEVRVSRAALHMWEEPCICGDRGSGTVFFTGCNLRCVFCQNHSISSGDKGVAIDPESLARIYLALEREGAQNINLVTGAHFILQIAESIEIAKKEGIKIPFVYNTSAYEYPQSLKILDGLVDIYMPDFKFYNSKTALEYSKAPDYPDIAKNAIEEMVRQQRNLRFDPEGILEKGVIIRHLLLPGHVYEAKQIMKYLWTTYSDSVLYSIMSQYTPMAKCEGFSHLQRKVRGKEYDSLVDYCLELGMENAYIQEGSAATESFIPDFDELKIPHI